MLDLQTVNSVFEIMSSRGDETVALHQVGGEWKPITSKAFYGRVRAVAAKLKSWGIGKGDRVALVSENRWEWAATDFAALAMGVVDVPLYQTLTPEQMGYMLRNSGAKAIFVSTKAQYLKVVAAGEIPSLEHVVVFDEGSFDGAESFAEIVKDSAALEQRDATFDAMVKEVKPEDLATIIYTSGTTGDPKGVMLTHGNLASNMRYSTEGFGIVQGDISISFLPLSHVTARHLDYALYGLKAVLAYCPKIDALTGAMKTVQPTIFLAVPRVYEKIRQSVEHKSTGMKKRILEWAVGRGKANRKKLLLGEEPKGLGWQLANKLVYSKIREAFGGRARIFIAGGAPLGMDSAEWFLDVGIRIFEGYGMTETSPVIARNMFDGYRIGTVGPIVPNMETRIAEDGELEVRGPAVFIGYWQNEEATKSEFTADGWFKTGDIGKIEDGFLSITDRKKELLKTSGGKMVAPQPIENKLKANSLVAQAALIGDKKKFISVLISPNFQTLESWAKQNGVATSDPKALASDPKVQQVYAEIVKKVNADLAHYEAIKKIGVVPEEWSVDGGELTPSMKLKRRVILEKYKSQIEKFYGE
ncbi:AMP-dependent synthetase/ligase [Granulicella mallensis]|uniref:Long-chain-fatty-acid--CoA ligase n=1 Tax=Granulicella mallensis (strain ATCC BAA-1857 / DSM 23137 / MP5ACTX8) TaxID=682795 RepID=G8P035_GRAMM|nr:long-chain fatty acid--CoA ligase [Granulicella mallensis]AEU35751.1 Long-chain-fatty-acid--CoA ligase [Granulicella mallensis MP5ACTX8]